jgi:hypothetical protein
MPPATPNAARQKASSPRTQPELVALPAQPARRSRVVASLLRVKATLDAGESLWTPVIMLGAGYAITIPAFLAMWGIATLAARLASGS